MRKSPQQPRARDKVQSILHAAKLVLIERGYENFTTNHVAGKAGCKVGTVYRYFNDKDEIFLKLHADWLEEEKRINISAIGHLDTNLKPADFAAAVFREQLKAHTPFDHALSVELTKAVMMNTRLQDADRDYENNFVDMLYNYMGDYTQKTLTRDQIRYALRLCVSLLAMVSLADEDDRRQTEEMAVETLRGTIMGWMN